LLPYKEINIKITDQLKVIVEKHEDELNSILHGQFHGTIYKGKIVNFWAQNSFDIKEDFKDDLEEVK